MENKRLNLFFTKPENTSDEERDETPIRWINIIFLPFNSTWKFIVLIAVLTKCFLGPLSAVYMLHCDELWRENGILSRLKQFYFYGVDIIYVIDTFLYIVHRQVTDEAVRREHLPKHAFLLLLDLLSLVPFYHLLSNEECQGVQFYPNIFAFIEILIAYRVVEYFQLKLSHSTLKLIVGYSILLFLYINFLTCLLLLLTAEGLCANCKKGIYDWRYSVKTRLNGNWTNVKITKHLYASALVLAITIHRLIDQTRPATYLEFTCCIILMILGYLLIIFIVLPKWFAEGVLRIRQICTFHPLVKRIIEETERRNSSPTAHLMVEKFYSLIWTKRSGISTMPKVIEDLPYYLQLSIKQDLMWPVIYHSPTFRKTSPSFKRWFSNHIILHYKLPNQEFFVGPHCYSNLYYIKTGVVQLISTEDNISSVLSMTSGTIFGDINFYIPPLNRTAKVICLTYCEVFFISRGEILKALHKFPEDRKNILSLTRERIKHAHTLHSCKNNIKGLDRKEDEGIAWIKRRWWDVSNTVSLWKKCPIKEHKVCKLSLEEANYHCPKYLGQLVLSTTAQVQKKSMFVRVKFPWILAPYSTFGDVWHQIVVITVYSVLFVLPPVIASLHTKDKVSNWFTYFLFFTDFVYLADVIVSVMTAVEKDGTIVIGVMAIIFERCKNVYFILDLLSTAWIEKFVSLIDQNKYYYAVQFNRLLKTYVLFHNNYKKVWMKNKNPLDHTIFIIILIHFVFGFVMGYFMFMVVNFEPQLTSFYFFGELCKNTGNSTYECKADDVISILKGWLFEIMYPEHHAQTIIDVTVAMLVIVMFFLMSTYTRTRLISALYLKNREVMNYYFFVSNLMNHYVKNNIHPNLLRRLQRYLVCHWKYYRGMDVMRPHLLRELPYDIYTKLHGEVADRIIGQSEIFIGADPVLIKDMSHKARFLILPRGSTIIAFGVHAKNVIWIVKGKVRCDYFDKNGKTVSRFYGMGRTVNIVNTLLNKASLRTFIAATDCEVLYIKVTEFFSIIKRYPNEWSYMETVKNQTFSEYESFYLAYFGKYKTHMKRLREYIFNTTKSTTALDDHSRRDSLTLRATWISRIRKIIKKLNRCRLFPESRIYRFWFGFRALIVIICITARALQGTSGSQIRPILSKIATFCDVVSIIDIVIKMFLPFYNNVGLVITDPRKCAIHYITRGFVCDIAGVLPWSFIFKEIFEGTDQSTKLFFQTCLEFPRVYLVLGYFNYLADSPTSRFVLLMLVKWQILTALVMVCVSHFLVTKCIGLEWDDNMKLIGMQRLNSCWLPKYLKLDEKPTLLQLHTVSAESLILAQCGLMMINLGKFHVDHGRMAMTISFMLMGFIFWFVITYSKTLLVLHYRGNTVFQHNVNQLKKFLVSERVGKDIIDKAVNHFVYVWIRTKGVQTESMLNERIGAVFRQDLSYYFFKKTYAATETVLGGGEPLERLLASNTCQIHFMPGQEIIKENELSHLLYIVHRGTVVVSKNGEQIATLTKGAIFGQLERTEVRPLRITAHADAYVDLLYLSLKQFQDIISDEIREKIAQNEQSELDYLAIKQFIVENPYNTIDYIMFQGRNFIKLPWMAEAVCSDGNVWYARWLSLTWLCGPLATAVLVLLLEAMPDARSEEVFSLNMILDILHVTKLISEFYSMEIVVVEQLCVKKYIRLKKLLSWRFYVDVISLLVPWIGTATKSTHSIQLVKLIRLHSVLTQQLFEKNVETFTSPLAVKFLAVALILHSLTCGWIIIACKAKYWTGFTMPETELLQNMSSIIDTDQWIYPNQRKQGCVRVVKIYGKGSNSTVGFLVPTQWYADYLLALTYVVIIQTHTNMDSIIPLTVYDMYYRVFMTVVLYLVEMYLTSVSISSVYTKLREVYYYDFCVLDLVKYLQQNGLSATLIRSVLKYTRLLWQRQRGTWLPELTQLAPECMREDILSALYMHHLENTPLFKTLPMYFLRQLVAKLKRVVIFPGHYIINEGDINATIYFIHEGEVEKWITDANGEHKMSSLLSGNIYFGLIPGLFPDTPYKYAYYTRTVVDLVYLRHEDWMGLLNSYPDLKHELYEAAIKAKNKY